MIYKITFYKFCVTTKDWNDFFVTLFSATRSFRLEIVRYGRQLDFFIVSEKKLDVLNSRTYPFHLSEDIKSQEMKLLNQEDGQAKIFPIYPQFNLLRTIERQILKGREIFKIQADFHKYNPFRYFPILKICYNKNGGRYKKIAFCPRHANLFLAFDLSNSIDAEISKVKPQLVSSDLKIELHDKGMLDVKTLTGQGFGKLSVKSYDFERHSLIVGQSGSGKSTFLKLLLEDLYEKLQDEYCVILLDPHASLVEQVKTIQPQRVIDFKKLATNLFVNINQPALSTELTLDLFSTILNVKDNQSLHRVLKYSLHLLYSIDEMSIGNLKNLLTDSLARKELLKKTQNNNLLQFFETEYRELFTGKYTEAILPIINLLSELDFINNAESNTSLVEEMNRNFLVSFPIQQTSLGKTITKIVGGALIQQVFTIAQAGLVKKKIVLIIDEVSVVQNPALIHILSEARKFGLTLILSQQYLMQVSMEILQSIFANTVNYFSFKVSRDDAESLARNLNCKVDEFSMLNKHDPREVLEVATKLLMDLNPREVVVRVLSNNNFYSPFKAKTIDMKDIPNNLSKIVYE